MLTTHKTHLSSRQQLSDDTTLFTFILDDPKEINFIAGQYLIMLIPDSTNTTAPVVRRLYSISSPPSQKDSFELMVHIIPDGVAGKYFSQLKVSDQVEFQGPAGAFIMRESSRDKVFLATGCGISPVRSMLNSLMVEDRRLKVDLEDGKSKLENPTSNLQPQYPASTIDSPPSNYYLFWGLPYYKDTYLFEELKNIKYRIPNIKIIICLSREQNLDMIPEDDRKYFMLGHVTDGVDSLITNNYSPITSSDFYICSGREVTESLKTYLEQKGAPKEQIYFEKF
jgi:Na+-transporting NADH:ubiquinone oxidoreductase subunit F